jgi:hypothetical protein
MSFPIAPSNGQQHVNLLGTTFQYDATRTAWIILNQSVVGVTGIQGTTGVQGVIGSTGLQGITGIICISSYGGATGVCADFTLPTQVYFGSWRVTLDSSGTIDYTIYNTPYDTFNSAPYTMGLTGIGIYTAGVKAQGTNFWGGQTGAAGNVVRVNINGQTTTNCASLCLGYYKW